MKIICVYGEESVRKVMNTPLFIVYEKSGVLKQIKLEEDVTKAQFYYIGLEIDWQHVTENYVEISHLYDLKYLDKLKDYLDENV